MASQGRYWWQPPELPKALESARTKGPTAQIKHFKESVLPLYVPFSLSPSSLFQLSSTPFCSPAEALRGGNWLEKEGSYSNKSSTDARFAPTVFYDWFLLTWPEPSAWLASRLAYSRTLAVMSMIGYVLGWVPSSCLQTGLQQDGTKLTLDWEIDMERISCLIH